MTTWTSLVERTKKFYDIEAKRLGFAGTALESAGADAKELQAKIDADFKLRPDGPGAWLRAAIEAHAVDDFPYLLAHEIGKAIADAQSKWQPGWAQFCGTQSLDKLGENYSRILLGEFDEFAQKEEGESVASDTTVDYRYQTKVISYGKSFSLTREAFINDDLNAWNTLVARFVRAAQRTLDYKVAATIYANGNAYDGTTFYHTNHGNTVTTALATSETGANLVSAACRAIRIQKDVNSQHYLALTPKYLVVPVQLESTAQVICKEASIQNAANALVANTAYPYSLTPVTWFALSAYDTNNWYVFVDPSECASWVVSFLNGLTTPIIAVKDTRRVTAGSTSTPSVANLAYDVTFEGLYDFGVDDANYRGSYAGIVSGGTP